MTQKYNKNRNYNNTHGSNPRPQRRISTVEDFKRLAIQTLDIEDYDDFGQLYKFTVKVKKVNLANMMATGKFPDTLLAQAQSLATPASAKETPEEKAKSMTKEDLEIALEFQRTLTKELLIEPAYEEIEEYISEYVLTQFLEYATGGMASLNSFRDKQKDLRSNSNSEEVQRQAE